jgi:tetratricopeptide (TPR) repeat protein
VPLSRTIPDAECWISDTSHDVRRGDWLGDVRGTAVEIGHRWGWGLTTTRADQPFAELPDPGEVGTFDELVLALRRLKIWAGDPSYAAITDRVNQVWAAAGRPGGELARKATVADCFKIGRRRMNADLVISVVEALHPDVGYVTQWRQALRVPGGRASAASQVRVHDRLPPDPVVFVGRGHDRRRLRHALERSEHDGGAMVVFAVVGMAGIGKTRLAIHAAHEVARQRPFDRVLFVNLRGFQPDPAQPPADPAAVLDGFLRLLGVPGPSIPYELDARAAAYRARLAGTRTLVVLDDAADAGQVRPLLPDVARCPVVVTSRNSLTDLRSAIQLTLDVFTTGESAAFLTTVLPDVPVGPDPGARDRIADRCGHLPLALDLLAEYIRGTRGWTLTDHADRLDEHHRAGRLADGVSLAIELSYRRLSPDQRQLLRLAALHPGHDLDAHAAAALVDTDVEDASTRLDALRSAHLVQQTAPGRYVFHDLVHAWAAGRTTDEDPPPERRAALTRLFDHYLATSAGAMDVVYPAEAYHRPRAPSSHGRSRPMADSAAALTWLDAERPTHVAIAAQAADGGWPTHATRLSATLYRYLDAGHISDALAVHGSAHGAAVDIGDPAAQAHASNGLGTAHLRLGRYRLAEAHLRDALELFQTVGDPTGQARVLGSLGNIEKRLGRYQAAIGHHECALALFRQVGDPAGEARSLTNLGIAEARLGRHQAAADRLRRALKLCREAGDRTGEADALMSLGEVETRRGRHRSAAGHLVQAIELYKRVGDRACEAAALDDLGATCTRLGQPADAIEHHERALVVFRQNGDRDAEAWSLNGLGEASTSLGRATDAVVQHTGALAIATEIGSRDQQARAHAGLGDAHRVLHRPARARAQYEQALALYAELRMPESNQVRATLRTLDATRRIR